MAGGHAQVMSAVEVSLALRVADTTRTDVAAALWEERSLVKTFGPRGTVHVLPAADLPWWLAALGLGAEAPAATPRASGCCPTRPTRSWRRSTRRCARRTAPPRSSTRTSPRRAARGRPRSRWRRSAASGRGGGWRSVRRRCAGCSASGRTAAARSPTRARAAGCPTSRCPDPAEAQLELLRAYLTAYGPATPAHLARWLATSPAWTSQLFERADLEEVELDGEPAWVWRGDTAFDAPEAPAVRLLPYFDAFQVGSQPRALLFPGRASERALAGAQAGNYPVVAARRRGGWGLAPEAVRQAVGRHRRAAGQTDEQAACRARRAGGPDRRDRRGHARVDGWAGDGGTARVALPACPTASTTAR